MTFLRTYVSLVTWIVTSASATLAQETDSTFATPSPSYPRFRSVLVDLAVSPFSASASGIVDFDLVRFPSANLSTFGVRFAVDRYKFGGPGGESSHSPALDYDLLIRHTASGRVLRFDIYIGYAYYTSQHTSGMKFGVEFRFAIIEHFWEFLGKLSLPFGLGFSAGWEQ